MPKKILFVTFDFPPSNAASIPRINAFYQYLSQWGWEIHVLTAVPKSYISTANLTDMDDKNIHRAFALDAHRQLSIKGKYISLSAFPDRWGLTWIPSALMVGRKLCLEHEFSAIWSTSPISSSHYISTKLAKWFDIPLVADYRDPNSYITGTAGKWLDRAHKKIDKTTIKQSYAMTFATSGIRDAYTGIYHNDVMSKSHVVENGFDENNFTLLLKMHFDDPPFTPKKFSLYYSGILYKNGRDPLPVFKAIKKLMADKVICDNTFELIFQGSGDGESYFADINTLGINNLVKFIDGVAYMQALNNMLNANALLLIQDSRFNSQIPGKVYEYLRTGKPILTKADPEGLTAKEASKHKGTFLCYNEDEVTDSLYDILNSAGHYDRNTDAYKREYKAKQLNDILLGACKYKTD